MNGKKAVIERVVGIINRMHSHLGGFRDGASFLGQSQSYRAEANTALRAWIEDNNPDPLRSFVQLLQMTNAITTSEADTLLDSIAAAEKGN